MYSIGPCPGEVLDHVLNFLAIDLLEENNIRAGPGVQNKPDLYVRCGAKNGQDQIVQRWAADSLSTPEALQPVPGLFQGWADCQKVNYITLHSMTGLS